MKQLNQKRLGVMTGDESPVYKTANTWQVTVQPDRIAKFINH